MNNIAEYICVGIGVMLVAVVVIAAGFISGEVLVWGCNAVGYKVDEYIVRGVWICVYFGVLGINININRRGE